MDFQTNPLENLGVADFSESKKSAQILTIFHFKQVRLFDCLKS